MFILTLIVGVVPASAGGDSKGGVPMEAGTGVADLDTGSWAKEPIPGNAKDVVVPQAAAEGPRWKMTAGPVWRRLGETTVRPGLGGSGFADRFFTEPPDIGPLGAAADRTYDDGFVNVGAATPGTGLTTFWGYDNASQLQGGDLVMTRTGGGRIDTPEGGRAGEEWGVAPYVEIGRLVPVGDRLEAGVNFTLSFAGAEQGIANSMRQHDVTATDRYDLNGIVAPGAPYAGSFPGPGPLIANQPSGRSLSEMLAGSQGYRFYSDVDMVSTGLGGELVWRAGERLAVELGAGVVANFVDWDAQWSADLFVPGTTRIGTLGAAADDRELLWGAYLHGTAAWEFAESWTAEGFLRYDWNESLEAVVGPGSFEVDLTGWSIGFGIGHSF